MSEDNKPAEAPKADAKKTVKASGKPATPSREEALGKSRKISETLTITQS